MALLLGTLVEVVSLWRRSTDSPSECLEVKERALLLVLLLGSQTYAFYQLETAIYNDLGYIPCPKGSSRILIGYFLPPGTSAEPPRGALHHSPGRAASGWSGK